MAASLNQPLDLAGWHGDPMTEADAAVLLTAAREARQASLRAGQPCPPCQLREMIARHWLGRPIEYDYRALRATAPTRAERARVELVYGQLLMAAKQLGAHEALCRGFDLAAPCLDGPGYLTVCRRHEWLGRLATTPGGAPPRSLAALLREARVIARLQGPPRRWEADAVQCRDTVG